MRTIKKKFCPKCQTWKPLSEFHKSSWNRKDYWCRGCCAIYRKKYCEENKGHIKAIKKKWYAENQDYNKKYYEENKEHYKAYYQAYYQTPKRQTYIKTYHQTPEYKAKSKIKTIKHKLDKIQRIPSWANLKKIAEIYAKASQLTKETGIQHSVDHVVPLQGKSVSGFHCENNLAVTTLRENLSKYNGWDPFGPNAKQFLIELKQKHNHERRPTWERCLRK